MGKSSLYLANKKMSSSQRRCEHCRKEGATKRCMKCTTCFYCDRDCQTKNWKKLQKRVCSDDPSMKPFVPMEMQLSSGP